MHVICTLLSCLPPLLALSSFPQTVIYPHLGYGFLFVARSWERSTRVGEEVNGLGEIQFLQVISPNLIVGR